MALQRKVTVPKSINLDVDEDKSKNADILHNVTNQQFNPKENGSMSKNDEANNYTNITENNENINSVDSTVSSRLSDLISTNVLQIEKPTNSHLINSIPTDLIQDLDSDDNNETEEYKTHKNSHSISDESFHKQLTRNGPTSLSGTRKAIKKTKVIIEEKLSLF